MKYYGIVDKIKDEHKSGIYGRRKLTKEEKKEFKSLSKTDKAIFIANIAGSVIVPFLGAVSAVSFVYNNLGLNIKKASPIKWQFSHPEDEKREIIFKDEILENEYEIDDDKDLFYGLFDNFYSRNKAFKNIMRSKGGSSLVITERINVPKEMHFGGENGKFSHGLYCCHPKDDNLLIPLENSNELIKTLILEETLRAYEALGAKKIIIEDRTEVKFDAKAKAKKVDVSLNQKSEKTILREKEFGKGIFDASRALQDSLFIHDFPNIMTTIKGRIQGNQLSEKFTESINLSVGLDVNVLELFKANVDFEYNRKWYFEVMFYDKNEN